MQLGSGAVHQSITTDMEVDEQEAKVKAEQEAEEAGEGFGTDVTSVLDSTAKR
jgi:hypothetical protein